jgi:hypothetical protein
MAGNPDVDKSNDLTMRSSCAPDPVPSIGSLHQTDLHNTGIDTFLKVGLVVGIRLPSTGCSLRLAHGGASTALLPRIPLGSLPSGGRTTAQITVSQVAGGTTRNEVIRATVEFASDFETDPQNDDPDTPYTCQTQVDVRI